MPALFTDGGELRDVRGRGVRGGGDDGGDDTCARGCTAATVPERVLPLCHRILRVLLLVLRAERVRRRRRGRR